MLRLLHDLIRWPLISTLPTAQGTKMIQLATFPKTRLAVIVNPRYVAYHSAYVFVLFLIRDLYLYNFLSYFPSEKHQSSPNIETQAKPERERERESK